MIYKVSDNIISINFNIGPIKTFLKQQTITNDDNTTDKGFLLFMFNGNGPDNADFKVISSNQINDDTKIPIIQSKTKLINGKFEFFQSDFLNNDTMLNLDIFKINEKPFYDQDKDIKSLIGIKYSKLIELDDYITFYLNNSCEITFDLITYAFR